MRAPPGIGASSLVMYSAIASRRLASHAAVNSHDIPVSQPDALSRGTRAAIAAAPRGRVQQLGARALGVEIVAGLRRDAELRGGRTERRAHPRLVLRT